MFLFGYIVSETKYNGLPNDIIQVVKNESECTLDVPKLIIGLSKAKEYAQSKGFEFDILDHMFPDGNMWTFKKTEKREIYEETIIEFKNYIIKSISKNINYYYINIYKLKYNKIKKLYNIINSKNKNYIYINRGMIYFLYEDNKILGLSLNMLRYAGIKSNKIINTIKSNPSNIIYDDDFPLARELRKEIDNKMYALPYLLSKLEQV